MPELIDRQAALKKMCETCGYCERFEKAMRSTHPDFVSGKCNNYKFLAEQPTIEPEVLMIKSDALRSLTDEETAIFEEWLNHDAAIEPEVRHGRWIECDYKHMEHGMIETEPKAGLCCSECRTGFKKNHMTYKAFCPACGARMDGGAENAAN